VLLSLSVLGLLFLAGICVGAEIPLFLKAFGWRIGSVLASDYGGAFAAGLLFPFLTLPRFGLVGSLGLAGLCHAIAAAEVFRRVRLKWSAVVRTGLGLAFAAAAAASLFVLFSSEKIERRLLLWITARAEALQTEVLTYFRTGKQSVLLVEERLRSGEKDRRLYLDGYLQSSSLWNERAYHDGLVLPGRRAVKKSRAEVLILGGGDGLAAETLLREFPEDSVTIVDFDGDLLERAPKDPALRQLAPLAWSSTQVSALAADAFWYVRRVKKQFDLILVDFPHGVGDAAAAKVESWEFFRDLAGRVTSEGRVVLHHERFGSESQVCVEETFASAGFSVEVLPMEESGSAEASLIGARREPASLEPAGQNWFRLPCQGFRNLDAIWLGA
jgi:spermidine synthase